MHLRRRPPLAVVLALLAWAMQLALPVVHAATMAEMSAYDASCGHSAALQAKLAQMPAELRSILVKHDSTAGLHATCVQLCAQAVAAPAEPILVGASEGALELDPAPRFVPTPLTRPVYVPPPRGPPSIS